jgi:TatD DNase family protein
MQQIIKVDLIDTHCHIDFKAFDQDRDQVLNSASLAGVRSVVNPGVDVASSRKAVDLANEFGNLYAAVGIHPNEATSWNSETLPILKSLAQAKKVVAIGEIGLDYYRDRTPRSIAG